jgi:hypothetical protein
MASWVGCCPGREESAAVSKSDRSPKGNRPMRRILNQAANAAVKAKGSVFEIAPIYEEYPEQGIEQTMRPISAPLSGVDFFVTEQLLQGYAEAAESFFGEIAEYFKVHSHDYFRACP